MLEILEFALSGFWKFVGCAILFNGAAFLLVNGLLRAFSRLLRAIMVSKQGWPPSHLDADGDWNGNNSEIKI